MDHSSEGVRTFAMEESGCKCNSYYFSGVLCNYLLVVLVGYTPPIYCSTHIDNTRPTVIHKKIVGWAWLRMYVQQAKNFFAADSKFSNLLSTSYSTLLVVEVEQ